ncbi:hypothetical protein KKB28_09105 [bacterium]|nr:hypothetical protein [bacterium]
MKRTTAFLCMLLFLSGAAFSQDFAIDKGALLVSGMLEYSSHTGDMYEGRYFHRSTEFAFTQTYDYFIDTRIFVGLRTTFTRTTEGDNSKTHGFGGGPEVGFAFGKTESQVFPYAKIGYQYLAEHSKYQAFTGYGYQTSEWDAVQTEIIYSTGVIVPIKKHFSVTCELSYRMQSKKYDDSDDSIKGNILKFGVGLSGLFF